MSSFDLVIANQRMLEASILVLVARKSLEVQGISISLAVMPTKLVGWFHLLVVQAMKTWDRR